MNPFDLTDNLPWAPDAEAGVIGAILMDNTAYDNVADLITPESFFDERAGCVFAAAGQLILAGKAADVISVHDQLQSTGLLGEMTIADIHQLSLGASSARNARRYAEIVADKQMARKLLSAADEVKIIAADLQIPTSDRIGQAQAKIESLQDRVQKSKPLPIQHYIAGALDRIQDLADGKTQPGIPTRLPSLDRALGGGLKGGKQMILAARPSVGKSSLAEQIALNVADQGYAAAMFSMEMTGQEMTDRAICNIGRIDLGRYATGKLHDEEWGRLAEAIEQMRDLPLHFDQQPAMTLQEISAKARTLKRKHDIKLLVLDYIQLCGTTNPKASRHHQLEEISRGLKALAASLDIAILTLSQLNREVEKRTSGRPILADLKESGAIEEDADVVMLMWKHMKGEEYAINGLDIAKNRGGRTTEVALHFEGAMQRWAESTVSLEGPKTNKSRHTEEF